MAHRCGGVLAFCLSFFPCRARLCIATGRRPFRLRRNTRAPPVSAAPPPGLRPAPPAHLRPFAPSPDPAPSQTLPLRCPLPKAKTLPPTGRRPFRLRRNTRAEPVSAAPPPGLRPARPLHRPLHPHPPHFLPHNPCQFAPGFPRVPTQYHPISPSIVNFL